MNRFPFLLALVQFLAFSAQSQTISFEPPFSQVRQFLGLTDDQVNTILRNNKSYNEFSSQQQQTIQQAQSQIAVETAKDSLDPIAIGSLYASIETTCRGLRDKASISQQQNISVLTDVQRAKLNILSDAMKLIPTIYDAQSGNLLGSAGSPPSYFTAYSSGSATFSSSFFSGGPGCGVTGVIGGVLGGFLPAPVRRQNGPILQ